MTEAAGSVYVEGLDELLRSFDKAGRDVKEAAIKAMEAEGLDINADAIVNLRENGTWVTGHLANSSRVERVRRDNEGMDSVDVGFFEKDKTTGYAEYLEYGRPPGKFPPPDVMSAWAYAKFRLTDWRIAASLGFLVGRKIALKGSTPHPFFQPSVTLHQPRLLARIKKAVKRVTDRNKQP